MSKEAGSPRQKKLREIARRDPTIIRDIQEGLQSETSGLVPLRESMRDQKRKGRSKHEENRGN